MKTLAILILTTFGLASGATMAQDVEDFLPSIEMFRSIPGVSPFFGSAYGYAVWRTIARAGRAASIYDGDWRAHVSGNDRRAEVRLSPGQIARREITNRL